MRHVERPLHAVDFHLCGRCGLVFVSGGGYVMHDCAAARAAMVEGRPIPDGTDPLPDRLVERWEAPRREMDREREARWARERCELVESVARMEAHSP